ncbi:agamous-like MADS-box protein MADS2 [Wolffia australiana]
MGRGRVELKRIENKINRQVTFAKRRNGLMKKAYELSVLCDAEVALIIFSNRGKLFEFSSNSCSMLKTLEKYQKCSYPVPDAIVPSKETQSSYQEYLKLKGRVEALQRSHRQPLPLSLALPFSLNSLSIYLPLSSQTQLMLDQLCDLRRKEQMLQESNRILRQKLQEVGPENPLQLSWGNNGGGGGGGGGPSTAYGRPAAHNEGLLQPMGFDPTPLQIGWYEYPVASVDQMNGGELQQNVNGGFVGGWMG